MPALTPAIFFGHGNPMNAIERNPFTEAWAAIGASLDRPKAVLMISAHWYVPGSKVTAMDSPRTIHDFRGFPPALSSVEYPAPGSPILAERVRKLLHPIPVAADHMWGLDHGTWSVLTHVFPQAKVPIVQLSIDETLPAAVHYGYAKRLAPLREEGILIAGSGNIVHNLREYQWGLPSVQPPQWASRYEHCVRESIVQGNDAAIVDFEVSEDAKLAAPTPDHFLPLIYVLGTRYPGETVSFPVEGTDGGSISMLSVRFS